MLLQSHYVVAHQADVLPPSYFRVTNVNGACRAFGDDLAVVQDLATKEIAEAMIVGAKRKAEHMSATATAAKKARYAALRRWLRSLLGGSRLLQDLAESKSSALGIDPGYLQSFKLFALPSTQI